MKIRIFIFYFLVCTSIYADFPEEVKGQILFQMHKGDAKGACKSYLAAIERGESHDFTLLQQAAMGLLDEGSRNSDPEIQLMCQFGAGIATTPSLLSILERGVHSKDLKIHMAALNFLAKMQDDAADQLVWETLIASPFLLARLEAGYQLAKKQYPDVLEQLQSFYLKMPSIVRLLFPQIIVVLNDPDAEKFLHMLLAENDIDIRIETVLQIAKSGRDELLPQIRSLATQTHFALTETCIWGLGVFRDENMRPFLHQMLNSKRSNFQLAAASALFEMGEIEAVHVIEEEARRENLCAITLLGECDCPSSRATLAQLLKSSDPNVRLNAIYALLSLRDEQAYPYMSEILIRGSKDYGFAIQSSPGRAFKFLKIVPSSSQHKKMYPGICEQSQKIREKALLAALEFPEEQFLKIVHMIFDQKEMDLIPALVELLKNHRTPSSIALLKEKQQKTGAPLIRNYCNLALYQMGVEGPYEQSLIQWVDSVQDTAIIRFKDQDPAALPLDSSYDLTPEETSALLIASFEALAQTQNEKGIEALIRVIAYGNPKNRYALAGLLFRTTE